jgi:hypothetical protein
MNYYLRVVPTQHGPQTHIWKFSDDVAERVGISNPEQGVGTYFKADPGETIWDAIRRMTPWFDLGDPCPFHKCTLRPGEYYPRMARPNAEHPAETTGRNPGAQSEANFMAIARGQLTALTRQLDRICQTVPPTEQTFSTFGHDIRNLLILACTEVESRWRGILIANEVKTKHFTTKNYVALREAMKLDEYAVDFPNYPWLIPLKPFEGWGRTGKPTRDLPWYDAYNGVKHNRETEFKRATLRHVFEAVTGCAIMMAAQFGLPEGLGRSAERDSFFHFSAVPDWRLSEHYIYSYGERPGDWGAVPFKFKFGPPEQR